MKQILDTACGNGDVTRAGLAEAKTELSDVDTGNLVVPLNLSVGTNKSPSRESLILQPTDVPGGAKLLQEETVQAEETADLA